jgi:large subunit ribosomal protein L23
MDILIRPIVTEKLTSVSEKLNRYGFMVERSANKLQIKDAIQKMYGVSVTDVNTLRYSGKRKARFTRTGVLEGKKNSYKKAIVTLAQGEKIDFYSNI